MSDAPRPPLPPDAAPTHDDRPTDDAAPTHDGATAPGAPPAVRFAAVGDSFTEGVGDPLPGGGVRGWADLVAEGLAARHGRIGYANVAIRGRLLGPIVDELLPTALDLDPRPTILTLNGGGNDMIRPRCDVDALAARTERAVDRALAAGVEVVVVAGADPSDGLPFARSIRERGRALTRAVEQVAAARGLTFVNAFAETELRRAEHWSEDRLHLNLHGHRRVADLVLTALGVDPGVARERPAPVRRTRRDDAVFVGRHVLPWVGRRLRRTSSGARRTGKHADWVELSAS